jgi:hypothetical protein
MYVYVKFYSVYASICQYIRYITAIRQLISRRFNMTISLVSGKDSEYPTHWEHLNYGLPVQHSPQHTGRLARHRVQRRQNPDEIEFPSIWELGICGYVGYL